MRSIVLSLLCLLLVSGRSLARDVQREALAVADSGENMVSVPVGFPDDAEFSLATPSGGWTSASRLQFEVVLPADAPTNAQVLVHLKDWDHFWFQTRASGYLRCGETNAFDIDLGAYSRDWQPRGHAGSWHFRVLAEPYRFGIRLFCGEDYIGKATVQNVAVVLRDDRSAPVIGQVRQNARSVPRFEKFEVTCRLPDRYLDPFDPEVVSLQGIFVSPSGVTNVVDGFYGQDFYRKKMASEEYALPQGVPYWQVRYAPREEGGYTFSLKVTDAHGEATWGPGQFDAGPAEQPGFIRVAHADPRYFEFEDGSPFFLIGHNIRSPFDRRAEAQYPWVQRWKQGATAYTRYFEDMSAHGENLAEVWTAAWSLGLEWSPKWRGYHGVGQYNMMHAWDLDQVVSEAARTGIYLNLVIHNHGKFSDHSDAEWEFNPFNVKNGGYLTAPEEYFGDARARESFRKLMRYMIARWGYSTRIFAWELWSELDLTGTRGGGAYKTPECVEWHRLMAGYVRENDPNRHLVATHVCGDYSHQNPDLISLDAITHCPIDAYHGNPDPLHIVTLMEQSLAYNLPYRKPVQITEFGGSSSGQGLKHLGESLHAALWAGACSQMPGTPMLWWWHQVEEDGFYPMYAAVARFMEGEDKRGVAMQPCTVDVSGGEGTLPLNALVLKSTTHALGWVYLQSPHFSEVHAGSDPVNRGFTLQLPDMRSQPFTVEFWDTVKGEVIASETCMPDGGVLRFELPPFARDIAFKVYQ